MVKSNEKIFKHVFASNVSVLLRFSVIKKQKRGRRGRPVLNPMTSSFSMDIPQHYKERPS